MNNKNDGRYSDPRDIYSDSSRNIPWKKADPYPEDEDIDCYNTVDRDIYSSSHSSGGAWKRRKKTGRSRKLFRAFVYALLLIILAGIGYSAVLYSRLDRSGGTAGHVQNAAQIDMRNFLPDGSVTNILLMGIDKNDDGTDGRSDSTMLLSVNSSKKTLHLVSFLRDTYLEIPSVGKNKLNAAFADGGPALTLQTLENNYHVDIGSYVSVDFNSFAKIIDKIGGLDVPMSQAACTAENENMGSHLKPGVNHLNGRLCLYYARIRQAADTYGHDDYGRASRQRQVIELIIQKMKTMNPLQANKIIYDYLPYVKTNMSYPEFLRLAFVGAAVSRYKTETLQIPAKNTFTEPAVKGIGDVVNPDLQKNCTILHEALYGSAG